MRTRTSSGKVLNSWGGAYIVTLVLCLLPLFVAPYPPATDLPQHVAQVARSMQGGLEPGQYVAWWAPNNLTYLPMMVLWKFLGAQRVASGTLIVLAVLWTTACFALARSKDRTPPAAVLASLCFYNGIFYWGMINFLLAWPCFVLWWSQFYRYLTNNKRNLPSFVFLALSTLLLAWAHVLALAAAAVLSLGLCALHLKQSGWKRSTLTLSTFLPTAALIVPWVLLLSHERERAGFQIDASFTQGLVARLHYLLTESGASGGSFSIVFGVTVLLWVLSGIRYRPRQAEPSSPKQHWSPDLIMTGLVLLSAALILPDKYLNTIQFANRWFPWAVALLCLGAPGPRVARSLQSALVFMMLASFSFITTSRFIDYNQHELFGFKQALSRIPDRARTIELDYLRISSNLPHARPFMHLSSYATVFRNATTHFDFGSHGTGLIRGLYAQAPWTPGIEWNAEWARPHDLLHFDYVLVGAPAELHGRFPLARWMIPVTYSGTWRLYKIGP